MRKHLFKFIYSNVSKIGDTQFKKLILFAFISSSEFNIHNAPPLTPTKSDNDVIAASASSDTEASTTPLPSGLQTPILSFELIQSLGQEPSWLVKVVILFYAMDCMCVNK